MMEACLIDLHWRFDCMELTGPQQRVTQHVNGHALCIAVAGSGKTTTLAFLINELLTQGIAPRRIMVMMFNKSAQLDFTRQLRKRCQQWPVLPEVRTYHSTGLRLLKSLEEWGLRSVYDHRPLSDKEIELKVRELLLTLAPDLLQDRIKADSARYIEIATGFIDNVKASLDTPSSVLERSDYPDHFRFLVELFDAFEQWRHLHRRITFTDMLYDTVCLIDAHPEVVPRITNKMDRIIVDEYQDTSTLQHRLTRIIAGERSKVIAVGDPDQTIYEFAGANIHNILQHFEVDYADTDAVHELTLPHTFRYGHEIAMAASHLISRNKDRKDVICIAHPDNPDSSIILSQGAGEDTERVLATIKQHISESNGQLAVLLRVWAQSVPLELRLLASGLSYQCDGPSLFDRPEISALIAALRLASGELQQLNVTARAEVLTSLFTLPHLGVKSALVQQLVTHLQEHEQHWGKELGQHVSQLAGIGDYQRQKLYDRAETLFSLEKTAGQEPAATILQRYIQRTELRESLQSMSLNDQRTEEQLLAIDGFLSYLKKMNLSVSDSCLHLDDLSSKQRLQSRRFRQQANKPSEQIIISSCHKAKGLEWPTVLIPGLTSKYWPFKREDDLIQSNSEDLEAERRLLYVAMTRAREKLYLFSGNGSLVPKNRNWTENDSQQISLFLKEMQIPHVKSVCQSLKQNSEDELISQLTKTGLTRPARRYLQSIQPETAARLEGIPSMTEISRSRPAASPHSPAYLSARQNILRRDVLEEAPWQVNRRLNHSIFGQGKVIEVNDTNFVILFDKQHGVKRFARNEQVLHLFELL
ncbi:ATP-dependent helicase [Endozoicomonas numazuensis]|uniref:ATP-dependent helicase n=1 Tax=Endozoicomonas numazuensis TaxID=1137799 RepID=UPI000690D28F|nr:ATP-dependent helicase [Endozoicomonas numazuensis]